MVVEFIRLYSSTKGTFRAGSIVELEESLALSLIQNNYAIAKKEAKRTATKKAVKKETR